MAAQSEQEVQQYLDVHKIQSTVESVINACVKANSPDPVKFMADHLAAQAKAERTKPAFPTPEGVANGEHPAFTLHYWKVPFRGNCIRNLFAFTNTAFAEGSAEELSKLKDASPAEQAGPFMAPPLLVDHTESDLNIAQSTAIAHYLASKLDLMPESIAKQAAALKLFGDALDLMGELRKTWEPEGWAAFRSGRFARWLAIFEATGKKHGLTAGAGYMLGTQSATLADLAAYSLLQTMERCLPELSADLRQHAPAVMALCDRLGEESEGLKALSAAQAEEMGTTYCGGEEEESIRAMLNPEPKEEAQEAPPS